MELEPYRYSSLRDSEIRILYIAEAPKLDVEVEIQCSIEHIDINSGIEYEALSYVWGSTERDELLTVTSQSDMRISTLPITANCRAALLALRRNGIRRVWVDAICINQDDADERNAQVRRMREIYQGGVRVVIYLGETLPSPLRETYESIDLDTCQGIMQGSNGLVFTAEMSKTARASTSYVKPKSVALEKVQKTVGLMNTLVSLPWFSRIWVLQEVSVSRKAVILFNCGAPRDWTQVLEYLATAEVNHVPGLDYHFRYNEPWNIKTTYSIRHLIKDRRFDLLELLFETRQLDATDPRDKVYALGGIAKDIDNLSLHIDYGAASSTVFTDLARAMVSATGKLDILAGVQGGSKLPDLPSWVPDFSVKPRRLVLDYPKSQGRYRASLDRQFCGTFESPQDKVTSLSQLRLRLKAIHTGYIVALSTAYEYRPRQDWGDEFITAQWCIPANQRTQGLAEWGVHLSRTLVAGTSRHGEANVQDMAKLAHISPASSMFSLDHEYFNWRTQIIKGRRGVEFDSYGLRSKAVCTGRRLAVTDQWHLVLVPEETLAGDEVFVLAGADVPYVLRGGDDGEYRLLGECYCHGIMKGEVVNTDAEDLWKGWRDICIA